MRLKKIAFGVIALLVAITTRFSFSAPSSEITRWPYLQEMTPHSVLIAWRTRTPMRGEVRVDAVSRTEQTSTTNHSVLIGGLDPSTRYSYRILGNGQMLTDSIQFKTFPEGTSARFSFAVFGDSGTASEAQKRIAAQITKRTPDFILHTGDVIYINKKHLSFETEFNDKFFSIYKMLVDHVPFFTSLGNHDVYLENGAPYLENFYVPGRYYSFDCAQAHFDALDSNQSLDSGSAEYNWFKEDLAKSTAPIKIVFFHHPVYSSGYHGSTLNIRKSLKPLFKKYRVTLVLNGHDHDYERSKPMAGTTYVVTGGGGAPLYPAAESPWTVLSETVYNFVLVKVDGRSIHLEAINDSGRTFDQDDIQVKQ